MRGSERLTFEHRRLSMLPPRADPMRSNAEDCGLARPQTPLHRSLSASMLYEARLRCHMRASPEHDQNKRRQTTPTVNTPCGVFCSLFDPPHPHPTMWAAGSAGGQRTNLAALRCACGAPLKGEPAEKKEVRIVDKGKRKSRGGPGGEGDSKLAERHKGLQCAFVAKHHGGTRRSQPIVPPVFSGPRLANPSSFL